MFNLFFLTLLFFLQCIAFSLSGEDKPKETKKRNDDANSNANETLKIGNLAFSNSQQPTPLVSFGQHLLDKKQAQMQVQFIDFKGSSIYDLALQPSLIYSFTQELSIFIIAPFAIRKKDDQHHSSGPEDLNIQFEYAFYTKNNRTSYDQATVVAGITIPTGSRKKAPPTGTGSNGFFIGATYSRLGIDWYYFTSTGGLINTCSHRTQFGNLYLYQFGLGRRIANTEEWLLDWMIEMDGTYSWKNKIEGETDPNSGGNVILLTPSLFFSTKESFLMQAGISIPIQQHLFGNQNKFDYGFWLNAGWTF